MGRGEYDRAVDEYQWVLARDPGNQMAKDGVARVLDIKPKVAAFLAGLGAAGVWLDPQTALMWTTHESEQNMPWDEAPRYCSALQAAGVSGWHVPSSTDFREIYDPGSVKHAGHREYYLRGGIELRHIDLWTSELSNEYGRPEGKFFFPTNGEFHSSILGDKGHVLCVRRYQPTDGLDGPQVQQAIAKPTQIRKPVAARIAALDSQADALYSQKRFTEALPLYAQACAAGDPYGCGVQGQIYAFGYGVTKDQSRGAELISKSSEGGTIDSCVTLGILNENGLGVPQNMRQADVLYSNSCDASNDVGCAMLAICYWRGTCAEKDLAKAQQFFRKACSLGNKDSCDLARKVQ